MQALHELAYMKLHNGAKVHAWFKRKKKDRLN